MSIFETYKISIVDLNPEIEKECREIFGIHPLQFRTGNIFEGNPLAIVSPANSFGIMTGGLDLAIVRYLGQQVEDRVKARINKDFRGELLVGQSFYEDTGSDLIPGIIVAPTMRTPQKIDNTINAYLAFKSILYTIEEIAKKGYKHTNNHINISGLGTYSGQLAPVKFARQAHTAVFHYLNPPKAYNLNQAVQDELFLLGELF